jgi:hypothetical protein
MNYSAPHFYSSKVIRKYDLQEYMHFLPLTLAGLDI